MTTNKQLIIEKLENILFECGWITRPHGQETDNILKDFESELSALESEPEEVVKISDIEIGNLVDDICYHQLKEEQADDFLEKVWRIKEWLSGHYNLIGVLKTFLEYIDIHNDTNEIHDLTNNAIIDKYIKSASDKREDKH